jgi:hypothetical protein
MSRENDQYCYFSVLLMIMNDSVYRDITEKSIDLDSNDMRTKENVDGFAS